MNLHNYLFLELSLTLIAPWMLGLILLTTIPHGLDSPHHGLTGSGFSATSGSTKPTTETRHLRVVLYPFIPDYSGYALQVLDGFRSAVTPDISLDLIDLSRNYYDPTLDDFVGNTDADVYEIDSVFLKDFVDSQEPGGKIIPLPQDLTPIHGELLPSAESGAKVAGTWYGVPHWVCSNFLFFSRGDLGLKSVRTFGDLRKAFAGPLSPTNGLLIDLKGRSTLGEFYIMSELDRYDDISKVYAGLSTFDPTIVANLQATRSLCLHVFCRDPDYHEQTGFYGRQFSRHNGRAVVGYSELMHDVLAESVESCTKEETCLSDQELDVAALPLDDHAAAPLVWVDSFVISRHCVKRCLTDAIAFIRYVTDDKTTLAALQGDSNGIPRYLMPARADLYTNPALTSKAHLYPALRALIENAVAPTNDGLNATLRTLGHQIDNDLGP